MNQNTNVWFRAEIENVCYTQVKMFSIGIGSLEPTGSMKVDVFDEKRIERVHVSHQYLVVLHSKQTVAQVSWQ